MSFYLVPIAVGLSSAGFFCIAFFIATINGKIRNLKSESNILRDVVMKDRCIFCSERARWVLRSDEKMKFCEEHKNQALRDMTLTRME